MRSLIGKPKDVYAFKTNPSAQWKIVHCARQFQPNHKANEEQIQSACTKVCTGLLVCAQKKEKLLRYADWNTPLYIVYDDSHYATFSYIQTKLEARPHAMTLHCFTAYTLPLAQGIVSHFPYLSMTPCVRPCCSVCLNGTSSPCDRWAPPLTVAVSHFWMQ